eukprot:gene8688-8869_t
MVKGKGQHAGRKSSLGFAFAVPELATAPKLVEEDYSDDDWEAREQQQKHHSIQQSQFAAAGPPQQLPRFFATKEEELQQLEVACRRILVNLGQWHMAAAGAGLPFMLEQMAAGMGGPGFASANN